MTIRFVGYVGSCLMICRAGALKRDAADGVECLDDRTSVDLGALHTKHGRWLSGALRRRFGAQESDDLLQDTWLRLASVALPLMPRHPRAFLLRIANNLAINRHHRRSLGARIEVAERAGDRCEAEQLERVLLAQIILGLPEPLRDVFLLSRVDGLSNLEIGEKLGISPKTVEWRMTRALAHCATQLRR